MSSAVTLMILKGIGETLLMVLCSTLFGYLFGLPLGVLLCISDEGGIRPNRILYCILDIAVNIGRSIPFIILGICLLVYAFKKKIPARAVIPDNRPKKAEPTHYAKSLNNN